MIRHKGTLEYAFEAERCMIYKSGLRRYTGYMAYRGKCCKPFNAYIRWAEEQVTIATIDGKGKKPERGGRMPIILSTLERLYDRVIIEQVLNMDLAAHLRKRDGYVETSYPGCETFTWDRRT